MNSNALNIWGPGQILAFSGLDGNTDFNDGLVLRTAFDWTGFEIKLPVNGGAIKVKDFKQNSHQLTLAGDFFRLGNTRGAFIDAWHILIEGNIQVNPGGSIKTLQKNNLTLIGSKKHFSPEFLALNPEEIIDKRKNSLKKFPVPEKLPKTTERALWKAYSQLRTQFCSPEGLIKRLWTTPDRWPHQRMWLWDSVFHAAGIRHLNVQAAREALSAVLECSRADGFIPLDANPQKISSITQPPLLALGVKLVQETEPDGKWLMESYPILKAYIEWDLQNRDSDGTELVEWYIEENELCRSGESGMDNSPRFDAATQLKATDFNAFLSLECEIMAEFAAELGLSADSAMWTARHKKFNELINRRLWNEDQGFYFDYDIDQDRMSEVMASSGFLPLICGAPSKEQAQKLVDHLNNPQTFKTHLQIASIAVCCEKYYSKDMWRGPVWININWLIARGLKRYGFNDEAERLIAQTMAEQEKMYLKYGTFFEFYDDRGEVDPPKLLRKGQNIPDSFHQVFHDYGWSATLYIDLVFDKYRKQT